MTRRSTSGGAAVFGEHLIKHWCTTQPTVALSSGEAELGGIVKGATQGIGLQSIALDLGICVKLTLFTDSKAARAMVHRKGIGKVRHLEVSELWVQDSIKVGKFTVDKIEGEHNPADILTKHVEAERTHRHCHALAQMPASGRAQTAPVLCNVQFA